MAALAANNGYISINGTVLNTYMVSVEPARSAAVIDTTSGFGSTHTKAAPGLKSTKFKLTVAYYTEGVLTYLPLLDAGATRTVIFGPDGNDAGKLRHQQDFVFSSCNGPKIVVGKEMAIFECDLEGAGDPVYDMYEGDTF